MGTQNSKKRREKKKQNGVASPKALADTHQTAERKHPSERKEPGGRSSAEKEKNELFQMCILKLYPMIKEEMEPTFILKELHSTLSEDDYNRIKKCQKRRPTIDMLLQTILTGSTEMQEAFKRALSSVEQQTNKLQRISKKLDEVEITDREKEVYQAVYNGKNDAYQDIPTDLLAKCEALVHTVDSDESALVVLMDKLLSRFSISFAEYMHVIYSLGGFEKKVEQLGDILSYRPGAVYHDLSSLCQDLDKQNDKTMTGSLTFLRNVNQKAVKRKPENGSVSQNAKRRRVFDPTSEEAIISNAEASTEIKKKAEELGLEYKTSFKSCSVVLRFVPKSKEWWNRLRKQCVDGKIAYFIRYLLQDVQEMKEGEYPVIFTIFKKPQSHGKDDIVEFHWEDAPEDVNTSHLQVNLKLLEEELEIDEKLMEYLKENKIVDVDIEDTLKEKETRLSKNMFLLKQIDKHGENGYEILKNYIEVENKAIYEEMILNEKTLSVGEELSDTASISPSTSLQTQYLVYSATLIVDIQKQDYYNLRGSKRKRKKTIINVPDILNPVCYFEKETTIPQKTRILPHVDSSENLIEELCHAESDGATEEHGSESKRKKKETSIPTTPKT